MSGLERVATAAHANSLMVLLDPSEAGLSNTIIL